MEVGTNYPLMKASKSSFTLCFWVVHILAANIARNFATASGTTAISLEIELLHEFREIVGVGVQVIAVPWLARAAMTAAIVAMQR